MKTRTFTALFKFHGLWYWALGIQIDVRGPSIDVHIPFGFFRIGWQYYNPEQKPFEKDAWGIGVR